MGHKRQEQSVRSARTGKTVAYAGIFRQDTFKFLDFRAKDKISVPKDRMYSFLNGRFNFLVLAL